MVYHLAPEPLEIGAKDPTSDDDRVLIALSGSQELWWALAERDCAIAEMVEHNHFKPEWRLLQHMATLRLDPPPPLGEAANVLNGFHRRFSRGPLNMWLSDPAAALPQELMLTWPAPQTFDEVTLTFDNLTQLRHDAPWECGQRVAPFLTADYELHYEQDGQWQTLVVEQNNHHRFRQHRFSPVTASRLRLRVLKTHGGPAQARVALQVRHTGSLGSTQVPV